MIKSIASRPWQAVVGLGVSVLAMAASAMTLGPVRGGAALGVPLDVSTLAQGSPGDSMDMSCVGADVFYGDVRLDSNKTTVSVVPGSESGTFLVRIRATAPVNEPMVAIVLRSNCGQKVTRRYNLLTDMQGSNDSLSASPVATASPVPATTELTVLPPMPAASAPVPAKPAPVVRRAKPAGASADDAPMVRPAPTGPAPTRVVGGGANGRQGAHLSMESHGGIGRLAVELSEKSAKVAAAASAADSRQRGEASSLWRALNRTPEQMAKDMQRAETLEAEVLSLRGQAKGGPSPAPSALAIAAAASSSVSMSSSSATQATLPAPVAASAVAAGAAAAPATAPASASASNPVGASGPLAVAAKPLPAKASATVVDESSWLDNLSLDPTLLGLGAAAAGVLALGGLHLMRRRRKAEKEAWWASGANMGAEMSDLPRPSRHTPPDTRHPIAPVPAGIDLDLSQFPPDVLDSRDPVMVSTTQGHAVKGSQTAFDQSISPGFPASVRTVKTEELFDIQQQADFFLSLGEDEQAISLLRGHIEEHPQTSPLAYLDLLKIYHSQKRVEDYEKLREIFNRSFWSEVPEFDEFLRSDEGLETYPVALSRIEALWSSPKVLTLLEESIFRQPVEGDEQVFSLQAYQDLLLLHAVAKNVMDRDAPSGEAKATKPKSKSKSRPGVPQDSLPTAFDVMTDYSATRMNPLAAERPLSSDFALPEVPPASQIPPVAEAMGFDAPVLDMGELDLDLSQLETEATTSALGDHGPDTALSPFNEPSMEPAVTPPHSLDFNAEELAHLLGQPATDGMKAAQDLVSTGEAKAVGAKEAMVSGLDGLNWDIFADVETDTKKDGVRGPEKTKL